MFKKIKKLKLFVITILVSMVFAVNLGFTFAADLNLDKVDYELSLGSDASETERKDTYLNDVVVNNSTKNIPIAYTLGTVQREINFDYSFSDTMDVAVTYELSYSDGTEPNNVILNVVDRDNYILDQEVVEMSNSALAHNSSSNSGTLYYLNTVTGNGNLKLFSGVTFLTGNNQVQSYSATATTQLGKYEYTANQQITAVKYEYTKLEISRFWQKTGSNYICKVGYTLAGVTIPAGVVMSESDFNTYIDNGAGSYTTTYTALADIKSGITTVYTAGTVLTTSQVTALEVSQRVNVGLTCSLSGSAYWTKGYKCVTAFTANTTNYVAGTVYNLTSYNSAITADSNNAKNFEICYTNSTAYSIQANDKIINSANSNNSVEANTVITAEEYSLLLPSEQSSFQVSTYKTFENKNLTIEVEVYASVSATSSGKTATEYYTEEHYFKTFKASSNSAAFSNWVQYKKTQNNVTSNLAMVYNAHSTYENAIPYAIDLSTSERSNISNILANSKSNLTSSYIYKKVGDYTYFHSYAGGNKYNAGVGVYYITSNATTNMKVSVSANWYNSNGTIIKSMPINNINLKYNGNDEYIFNKVLGANSYGYIDILSYIQTTTAGELFDMTGYSLVITSVTVVFESTSSSASSDVSKVQVTNSTAYNPILYTLSSHQTVASTVSLNISITNNSSTAIKIPTVTLNPTFTAYNGSTALGSGEEEYGPVATKSPTGITYRYDNTIWSNSGNTFSSSGYLAPYTSLTVVSGISVPKQTGDLAFWAFNFNNSTDNSYYADYWLEVGVSYTEPSTTTSYTMTTTHSAEIMTSLTNTRITTTTSAVNSYIAIRNNTLQTMTALVYSGTLQLGSTSNRVSFSLDNGSIETNTNNFTVSLNGINLMPGESIFICRITINENQEDVWLSSSDVSATLTSGAAAEKTEVYFKRDFASGNLSIINASSSDTGLMVSIDGVDSNTDLNGGSAKWSSTFEFITQDATKTLAVFNKGQMINLLSNITENVSSFSCQLKTIS